MSTVPASSKILKYKDLWPIGRDHYKAVDMLGRGSFGTVYRAVCSLNKRFCAVKKLSIQGKGNEELARREAKALLKLNSPYIVKLYSRFDVETNLWLVMENMQYSLNTVIDKRRPSRIQFTESTVIYIIKSMAKAIEHMTMRGIVHKDIKPDNVLIGQSGEIKICDFGLVGFFENGELPDKQGVISGTCPYMSPEVFLERTHDSRSDIWSFGMTILDMIMLQIPIEYSDDLFTILENFMFSIIVDFTENYTEDIKIFLYKTLITDCNNRLSISELVNIPIMKEEINMCMVKEELLSI